MRALTVRPDTPNTLALSELPMPEPGPGELLVRTLAIGVCGTDHELMAGEHGCAPHGERQLIIGHESLGEVLQAPKDARVRPGELVVGVVRRPDPVPCPCCAAGEWDMCLNGRYTERGIKERHGYASDVFTLEEHFAVVVPAALRRTGVLLEPTSVVAKGWEQVEHTLRRFVAYTPRRVLVTGAGPIGLLAALIGAQRGYDVTVLDKVTDGPKPQRVRELGAAYCSDFAQLSAAPEIVIECTGVGEVVWHAMRASARNGIVCLTGLSTGARKVQFAVGDLNNTLVLENDLVLGSVNANLRHYRAALDALVRAPDGFLERLITRRVPVARYAEAFERRPGDVKVVLDWEA